jgi:LysM repeat protein
MKITITIDEILKKPVMDWEDQEDLQKSTDKLPKNVVKLENPEETDTDIGENAEPFTIKVKRGDTLKKISEEYGVSYGELSNHLMKKQGTTAIHEGMEIEIPRHFIDLSGA